MVGGVPGEDVGQARLDPDADQREPARRPPSAPAAANCSSPSLTPRLLRTGRRVRPGQRHRHVEVVGAGRECPVEDRHHEPRVDRVEHMGDRVLAAERGDRGGGRGVDPGGDEPVVGRRRPPASARAGSWSATTKRSKKSRRAAMPAAAAHAAGADQKDAHVAPLEPKPCSRRLQPRKHLSRASSCDKRMHGSHPRSMIEDGTHDNRPSPQRRQPVEGKGLNLGAIGLLSSIVIGVASTAPGYSVAASLGGHRRGGRRQGADHHAARVHADAASSRYAYKSLNARDPDCGTSFTWVARALGPRTGWLTGWVIIVADMIVMAIAGRRSRRIYTLPAVRPRRPGRQQLRGDRRSASCWIAADDLDRLARHRDVRPHPVRAARRPRCVILAIFAVVALWQGVRRHRRRAGHHAVAGAGSTRSRCRSARCRPGFLLAVFIYWGWDSAVAANEETDRPVGQPGPGGGASRRCVLVAHVRRRDDRRAGVRGRRRRRASAWPTRRTPTTCFARRRRGGVRARWGVKLLIIAVLTSAAASTQTTILPTARDHAVDGGLQGAAEDVRDGAPAVPDADRLDLGDGHRGRSSSTAG